MQERKSLASEVLADVKAQRTWWQVATIILTVLLAVVSMYGGMKDAD